MKALKLKSSPDDNPVWGVFHAPMYIPNQCKLPAIVGDFWTDEILLDHTFNQAAIRKWELVTVELTIKR